MAELRWATGTHEGQVREINEDAAFAAPELFVVADGMGGHLAGEVASALAIETLSTHLIGGEPASLDDLVAAIASANAAIFNDASSNADHNGMGTTVTAIAVVMDRYDGEALGIANVGDSRIYLLRHKRLRQVTVDHSFVQELIAEGAITREEARHHPRRNIVTRGLGIESSVRVDSWTMPLIRGDRFVLCSDGLSDYVVEDDITDILLRHPDDLEAAIIELIDAANDAGGPDNITIVIVDVLDGEDPPDPTEEIDVVPAWFDEDDDTGEAGIYDTKIFVDADGTDALAITGDGTDADEQGLDDSPDRDATVGFDAMPPPSTGSAVAPHGAPAASGAATATAQPTRSSRIARFLLTLGVATVLIIGFAVFAGWARSGYYIAFDSTGHVVIYQGRKGGVLWFEPTQKATGLLTRDELDDTSIGLVEAEPEFKNYENATEFVANRLKAKTAATPPPDPGTDPPTTTTKPRAPTTTKPAAPTTTRPAPPGTTVP